MKRSASQETCLDSPKRIKPNDSDENLAEEIQQDINDSLYAPPAFVQKMAVKRLNAAQDIEIVKQFVDYLTSLVDEHIPLDDNMVRKELFERGIDLIKERYQIGKFLFLKFPYFKNRNLNGYIDLVSFLNLWDYKTFVTAIASKFERTLEFVPEHIKQEKYIANIAVNSFVYALRYLPDNLLKDTEFALKVFHKHRNSLRYFKLSDNKEFLKSIASIDEAKAYDYASAEMKRNKEVVLTAVLNEPNLIYDRSGQQIRNIFSRDKQFVVTFARSHGAMALDFASSELRNDKEIALLGVVCNGLSLKLVSDDLRNDKEVVMKAISNNPLALEFVSNNMRRDKEVVMKAISYNPMALVFASDGLKNDKEIALAAVSRNGLALELVSVKMRIDKDVVIHALSNNILALEFVSSQLKKDMDIALTVVATDGLKLEIFSDSMRNDKDLVMKAISSNPLAFEFASESLRSDKEVVIKAVSKNAFVLKHSCILDPEIIIAAAWQNIGVLGLVSKKFLQKRDVTLELFEIHPYSAQDYLPEKFRKDKKFLMQLAKQNGIAALQFARKVVLDRKIVIAAVSNDGRALEYAPVKFQEDEEIVTIAEENMGDLSDQSDEDAVEYCDTESDDYEE